MQRPTNGSACPFSSQAEFWSILLFVASVFKHSEVRMLIFINWYQDSILFFLLKIYASYIEVRCAG